MRERARAGVAPIALDLSTEPRFWPAKAVGVPGAAAPLSSLRSEPRPPGERACPFPMVTSWPWAPTPNALGLEWNKAHRTAPVRAADELAARREVFGFPVTASGLFHQTPGLSCSCVLKCSLDKSRRAAPRPCASAPVLVSPPSRSTYLRNHASGLQRLLGFRGLLPPCLRFAQNLDPPGRGLCPFPPWSLRGHGPPHTQCPRS